MKYIHIDFDTFDAIAPGALYVDSQVYRSVLVALLPKLPPGARAFASDVDHYDFYSRRCTKDLEFVEAKLTDVGRRLSVEMVFRGHPIKHDEGLVVSYENVSAYRVTGQEPLPPEMEQSRFGDVILDELLPHAAGVSHEIAFHHGTIEVIAEDLVATWST